MVHRSAIRLYGATLALAVAVLVLSAAPALAQYESRKVDDPGLGERYHIEASAGLWMPSATMSISSESLGISGDDIDFKRDLGLRDKRFPEVHLVLRPARKHKFRFQYIPILYEQSTRVSRDVVFNGQRYRAGVDVASILDWKAYRFGYEYDFIARERGFGGVLVDFKYTDVNARLSTATLAEFTHAAAPIPALGGIVRVYPVRNVSVTVEMSGVKIPDTLSKTYKGHYADLDISGTYNLTRNVGAQVGYRSLDVGYKVNRDSGSFVVNGLYFGVVARY
jgi:hypothetical protein